MKKKGISLVNRAAIGIAVSLALSVATASGQHANNPVSINAAVRTDSRILYHSGPVRSGRSNVYFIWYGCWTGNCPFGGDTQPFFILTDFISNLGSTPYFQINSTYPDGSGQVPSGALLYGGSVDTTYSHGFELTASDIQGIISLIKSLAAVSHWI